ncbi:MAG: beta-galactosidase [Spirochaetes bacterium]|jgi:beta-galactosidase|nr:beta-galactosidase [Spirochaetota bacterium]
MNQNFTYSKDTFLKDGEPFRIISGSIHYFRVIPEYWLDRLTKLKEFGCNTVDTYIPWNLHEPTRGNFDFAGILDLERFIQIASELDLLVILRPGPFICAEIDSGGIPSWLTKQCDVHIRCSNTPFLNAVDNYYKHLFTIINNYLYNNGGSVIMVQVENEYGAYGNDKTYLHKLKRIYDSYLGDVLYISADQPTQNDLRSGFVDGALVTTYFGSMASERLSVIRTLQPDAPLFCLEFWSGWYDYWEGNHHIRSAESTAETLDAILATGASVNLYMFHGGTNFGFTNGATCHDGVDYKPVVTSYDYDALLNEAGDLTPKYHACREVLKKYCTIPPIQKKFQPDRFEKKNIIFPKRALLFESINHISTPVLSPTPLTMETLGQDSGFILYRTNIDGPYEDAELKILGLHDRALLFINEVFHNTLYRNEQSDTIIVDIPEKGAQIDILVENMGHIDYGPYIGEQKGITHGVQLNNRFLFEWEIYPLPLDNVSSLPFEINSTYKPESEPTFYSTSFTIERQRDTFLNMDGWEKGVCFINGFNLGRYWKKGPQQTLYVPGPLLRKGKNELIIFELHKPVELSIEFVKEPSYGKSSQIKKSILSRLFSRT